MFATIIYTTISIRISIDGYILYIHVSIYTYMYLYSLDIQRPEKDFLLGFSQQKIMIRSTGSLSGAVRQDV